MLLVIRHTIQIELSKVYLQLKLFLRHDATQVTALVLLILALFRRYLRDNLKTKLINTWVANLLWSQNTIAPPPPPAIASSIQRVQSLEHLNIRPLDANATRKLKRNRSREALQTLLQRSKSQSSLCSDCISRASSHNSLASLADELDYGSLHLHNDEHDDDDHHQPQPQPQPPPYTNKSDIDSLSHNHGESKACVVCASEQTTYATYVKRILLTTSSISLVYFIWLRFVASNETAFSHLTFIFRGFARLWRYKVVGDDIIPRSGPAVVTVYHGFIPLDMYFFQEYTLRNIRKDSIVMVADFVFNIPILGWIIKHGGGVPANGEVALKHLQNGGLLVVAPGGVREAITPTIADYSVLWGSRSGFARIARDSSATIIPMFTKNIREVFLVLGGDNWFVQWIYRKTKLPFAMFFGPFLVPLTTMFGEPMGPFPPDATSEAISKASQVALQSLMTRFSGEGGSGGGGKR
jgi:1-acyl-sn-glycerol-3-phosphate acyltransferase